jgi:hypothetical protein
MNDYDRRAEELETILRTCEPRRDWVVLRYASMQQWYADADIAYFQCRCGVYEMRVRTSMVARDGVLTIANAINTAYSTRGLSTRRF